MSRAAANSLPPDPHWLRGQTLSLEGVQLRRGETDILRGVDLRFQPDHRYVLLGPSGAGKSTLLRLLNRLEDPTSGRVLIGGISFSNLPVRSVRRGVGLVFQNARPLPGTLADNLAYPFGVRGLKRPESETLVQSLAEFGLDPGWIDRDAEALSGGERQRLAIATALGAEPEILVLDEPTAALDPTSAQRVAEALDRRARAGLRTIAVCHHPEYAAWLGEVAVVLVAGRVADQGPTAEVLARCDQALWEPSEVRT